MPSVCLSGQLGGRCFKLGLNSDTAASWQKIALFLALKRERMKEVSFGLKLEVNPDKQLTLLCTSDFNEPLLLYVGATNIVLLPLSLFIESS